MQPLRTAPSGSTPIATTGSSPATQGHGWSAPRLDPASNRFSPFVRPSDAAVRKAAARELRKACVDIEFLYVVNHGISAAEKERPWAGLYATANSLK